MNKLLQITILLCACSTVFAAQESEKRPFHPKDFLNQSLITIFGKKSAQRCEAVRITPTWYLTAAHCVYPTCEKSCRVEIDLLQGELEAVAQIKHSARKPMVFYNTEYRPQSFKNERYDVALIHFIPKDDDFLFFMRSSNESLKREEFFELLNSNALYVEEKAQWEALEKANPVILTVDNLQTREFKQSLAVPDLRSGYCEPKQSDGEPYYYFTELWHYFGRNFGVGPGMSGGGVIIPGGTLIGVVSANINKSGELIVYGADDKPVRKIPYSDDYFAITPFNYSNRTFIENTMARNSDDCMVRPYFGTLTDWYAKPVDYTVEQFFGLDNEQTVSEFTDEGKTE